MRLTIKLLSSVKQRRPFYITTPIFYVNAAPHIGHLYSAVLADAVQRFEKLVDPDINVIFSTGTDEHGTKIQQAASKANVAPQQYCDNISQEYVKMFKNFNVGYTDFVRTTEDRHKKAVYHFWNKLREQDYIYKAQYSGWYSVNDEAFVPETHLKDDVRNGEQVKVSIESGHQVEWTEETNYMFRLSAFKTHLQQWLKNDGVIVPAKYQRQLQESLAAGYLPDLSVSRPAQRVRWALPVPGDEDQSVYVWLDALVNYLTVSGYPDEDLMKEKGRIWPADLHVVGKDILKFHAIYWPAFLMAIRRAPPRRLLCHAHWTVDGTKMSKSLNNVVAPDATLAPNEALRYLLLREHTLHSDANFSSTKLVNTINSELADTLGNLAARSLGAALNQRQELPALPRAARPAAALPLTDSLARLPDICRMHYTNYQLYKVVDEVMRVLHLANQFFEVTKPWELRKKIECQTELDMILHITIETLRVCGIILQPIIPEMSSKLLDKLQVGRNERNWENCEQLTWNMEGVIHESRKLQSGSFILFQRIYVDKRV